MVSYERKNVFSIIIIHQMSQAKELSKLNYCEPVFIILYF